MAGTFKHDIEFIPESEDLNHQVHHQTSIYCFHLKIKTLDSRINQSGKFEMLLFPRLWKAFVQSRLLLQYSEKIQATEMKASPHQPSWFWGSGGDWEDLCPTPNPSGLAKAETWVTAPPVTLSVSRESVTWNSDRILECLGTALDCVKSRGEALTPGCKEPRRGLVLPPRPGADMPYNLGRGRMRWKIARTCKHAGLRPETWGVT